MLQYVFLFLGFEKKGKGKKNLQAEKSRIICTFSKEEKVRTIRQLKKVPIILDENR